MTALSFIQDRTAPASPVPAAPASGLREVLVPVFLSRAIRMFAFGGLAMVFVLYLDALGWDARTIGILLTASLLGDAVLTWVIASVADRLGRRNMLMLGGALMALAGLGFLGTGNPILLFLFAILGILSPTGSEAGPFSALEQTILAHVTGPGRRSAIFAWYNLAAFLALALGSFCGGAIVQAMGRPGASGEAGFRIVLALYALSGCVLAGVARSLPRRAEIPAAPREGALAKRWHEMLGRGLGRSKRNVCELAGLYALDAFGSGFMAQSLAAFWLHVRFGMDPMQLGAVYLAGNLISAASALLSPLLSARIGLLNVMVFAHLPANVCLLLIPFMPTCDTAIAVLLLRFLITQLDAPARQAYLMAMVAPSERSAAAGLAAVARSLGIALAPAFAGRMLAEAAWMDWIFYCGGGCKIAFDALLFLNFRAVPLEEGAK